MALVKCTQTKCAFHESNGHPEFCPICDCCGATGNMVEDDTCVNCWNCLKDRDYIRSGVASGVRLAEKMQEDCVEAKH